jgi:hypothetical protein
VTESGHSFKDEYVSAETRADRDGRGKEGQAAKILRQAE